jgi:hypothetical protein
MEMTKSYLTKAKMSWGTERNNEMIVVGSRRGKDFSDLYEMYAYKLKKINITLDDDALINFEELEITSEQIGEMNRRSHSCGG